MDATSGESFIDPSLGTMSQHGSRRVGTAEAAHVLAHWRRAFSPCERELLDLCIRAL